jgi:hypothetical protein
MNTSKAFKNFWNDLHSKFPEFFTRKFEESDIKQFGETFSDFAIQITRKDETMWETPKLLFDVDLSELWKKDESSHSIIWKHLQPCGISYLLTELKSLDNKVIGDILKNFTNKKDEIDEILNGENESKFTEFLEFLKNLKMISYFVSLIEKIDMTQIVEDFESMDDIMSNFKNISQTPKFQEIQRDIRTAFENKVKSGEISRQVILTETEQIKQKASELFGDIFNDALGGRKADVEASTILGNTPEARRARMVARLQRKLKERK